MMTEKIILTLVLIKNNKTKEIDNNYSTHVHNYHANSTIKKWYLLAYYKLLAA